MLQSGNLCGKNDNGKAIKMNLHMYKLIINSTIANHQLLTLEAPGVY